MLCFLLWFSSSCFLCSHCYQCLLIVHSGFVLWFSLTVVFPSLLFSMLSCVFVCLRPVSCVPNVASVSWFAPWFYLTFVFPSLYVFVLSCVFCVSSSWVLFPNVANVSRVSVLDCSFGFLYRLFAHLFCFI